MTIGITTPNIPTTAAAKIAVAAATGAMLVLTATSLLLGGASATNRVDSSQRVRVAG
jgi:predicted nuclease with TOPRIM domain